MACSVPAPKVVLLAYLNVLVTALGPGLSVLASETNTPGMMPLVADATVVKLTTLLVVLKVWLLVAPAWKAPVAPVARVKAPLKVSAAGPPLPWLLMIVELPLARKVAAGVNV